MLDDGDDRDDVPIYMSASEGSDAMATQQPAAPVPATRAERARPQAERGAARTAGRGRGAAGARARPKSKTALPLETAQLTRVGTLSTPEPTPKSSPSAPATPKAYLPLVRPVSDDVGGAAVVPIDGGGGGSDSGTGSASGTGDGSGGPSPSAPAQLLESAALLSLAEWQLHKAATAEHTTTATEQLSLFARVGVALVNAIGEAEREAAARAAQVVGAKAQSGISALMAGWDRKCVRHVTSASSLRFPRLRLLACMRFIACTPSRALPCMCLLACAPLHALPCMRSLASAPLHALPNMCLLACTPLQACASLVVHHFACAPDHAPARMVRLPAWRSGDGVLNKLEFRGAVRSSLRVAATGAEIDDLFKSLDADGSGTLQKEELRKWLAAAKEAASAASEVDSFKDRSRELAKVLAIRADDLRVVAATMKRLEWEEAREAERRLALPLAVRVGLLMIERRLKSEHVAKQWPGVEKTGSVRKAALADGLRSLGLVPNGLIDAELQAQAEAWFDSALVAGVAAAAYREGGGIALKPELSRALKAAKAHLADYASNETVNALKRQAHAKHEALGVFELAREAEMERAEAAAQAQEEERAERERLEREQRQPAAQRGGRAGGKKAGGHVV